MLGCFTIGVSQVVFISDMLLDFRGDHFTFVNPYLLSNNCFSLVVWNDCVTNDHQNVPLVIITIWSFPHLWLITVCARRVARRVAYVAQELHTFRSTWVHPGCQWGHVDQPLVFSVLFWRSFCPFWCLFFNLRFWLSLWYLQLFLYIYSFTLMRQNLYNSKTK